MRWMSVCLLLSCIPLCPPARGQEDAPPLTIPPVVETDVTVPERDRFAFRAEYLYWYLQELAVPPVLTTGPAGSSAALGEPGTQVLRGGTRIESRHDRYIGVRARGDWWLGEERDVALQFDAFFLERDSTHFTVRPGQVPVLAIPYFDAETGQSRSFVIAGFNPERGEVSGGSRLYTRMELFGQEGNALFNLGRDESRELNLIVGTRFLQLRERLDLTSASASVPDGGATVFGIEDHIQTFDKFYGAQAGLLGTWRRGRWFLEGKAAVALGANEQLIRSKGVRIRHSPLERIEEPYGLFVLPSNRGAFDRWSFDAVTDLRINLGFNLRDWATLLVGYSLLTWSGPVRPGDQVQPVNLGQLTGAGAALPQPNFHEDFFYAQGLSVGMSFQW